MNLIAINKHILSILNCCLLIFTRSLLHFLFCPYAPCQTLYLTCSFVAHAHFHSHALVIKLIIVRLGRVRIPQNYPTVDI